MLMNTKLQRVRSQLREAVATPESRRQLLFSIRRVLRIAAAEASVVAGSVLEPTHRATCRACKSESARLANVGPLAATHPGPFHVSRFMLTRCFECDVLYLDPPPTADDLDTLYKRSGQFDSWEYSGERQAAILEYMTSAILGRRLLPRPGIRCLEMGAGLAWMSRACKALDASVVTVAQDVTDEAAARCAWVDRYFVGDVEALTDEAPFDLISLTHVIEHLSEPLQAIEGLARRLAPGGKIFVTAPYRPTPWPRLRSDLEVWKKYSYLHVPAHISYLSRRWFKKLESRTGLRLESWDPMPEDGQAFEAVLVRS